ncbi:MAG: hypothetical protein EBU26_18635 [Verrucomicrobia bacterium]|nr:hypothetical protein [Verrucomicrobiota bacterium]
MRSWISERSTSRLQQQNQYHPNSGIQSSNRYPTVGDDSILRPEKIPQSSVDIPGDSLTSEEELPPKTSNAQASIRIDASESVNIIMCLPGECVINIDTEAMISTT